MKTLYAPDVLFRQAIKRMNVTKQMEETLMDCHERELMGLEPCEVASTPHAKELLTRGLLEVKEHFLEGGKKIVALFVSDLGQKYLSSL